MIDAPAGTHAFLREYAAHMPARRRRTSFTIGEVSGQHRHILAYYPDQLDAYFAFEVADSIISAVKQRLGEGTAAPVLRLQRDAPRGRWSPFLRNHDQTRTLTEARRRHARARALAAMLLLTLPGIPFVYYGEEIGMTGDKPTSGCGRRCSGARCAAPASPPARRGRRCSRIR